MNQPTRSNVLDVEDEDERLSRIERLLSSQSSSVNSPPIPLIQPLNERKTYDVPPPTDLLARLSAFLPAIKQANQDLEKKISVEGQKSVDIENLGDDDASTPGDEDEDDAGSSSGPRKPYIEMDLGLGVFEQKPKKDGRQPPVDDDTSSSDSSDLDSSDEDSDIDASKLPSKPTSTS